MPPIFPLSYTRGIVVIPSDAGGRELQESFTSFMPPFFPISPTRDTVVIPSDAGGRELLENFATHERRNILTE